MIYSKGNACQRNYQYRLLKQFQKAFIFSCKERCNFDMSLYTDSYYLLSLFANIISAELYFDIFFFPKMIKLVCGEEQ